MGRAEQGKEYWLPLGDGNSLPFPFARAVISVAAGVRLVPRAWSELEDEVGQRRPSRQVLQRGNDNDWLGCLTAAPPSVFTCPRSPQLGQGGRAGAQRIRRTRLHATFPPDLCLPLKGPARRLRRLDPPALRRLQGPKVCKCTAHGTGPSVAYWMPQFTSSWPSLLANEWSRGQQAAAGHCQPPCTRCLQCTCPRGTPGQAGVCQG